MIAQAASAVGSPTAGQSLLRGDLTALGPALEVQLPAPDRAAEPETVTAKKIFVNAAGDRCLCVSHKHLSPQRTTHCAKCTNTCPLALPAFLRSFKGVKPTESLPQTTKSGEKQLLWPLIDEIAINRMVWVPPQATRRRPVSS